jgi:hypothetical protein
MVNTTDKTITVTKSRIENTTIYTTQSRSVFTGFDDVAIARPKFIYFKVSGLRPNDRHFFFFDGINVTNYVTTDAVTVEDFYNLPRNDSRRNPGEKYKSATGFPSELGGPTSEIYADDTGTIEGVFYLQSNSTLSFPAGTRNFTILDISKFSPNTATSQATQEFTSDGGVENYRIDYYTVATPSSKTVTWTEVVDNPNYVEPTPAPAPTPVSPPYIEPAPVNPVTYVKVVTPGPVFQFEAAPDPIVCFLDPEPPETYEDLPPIQPTVINPTGGNSTVISIPTDDGVVEESGSSNNDGLGMVAGAVAGTALATAGTMAATAAGAAGFAGGAALGLLACCFIMLEARYGNGTMDNVVRRYRDEKMTERNRRGYYKVAEVLVPMMRKSRLFKWVVTKTFADPLVCYGKWYYGENKYGWIFKPVEKFWMSVFNTVGGDVQFIRENGEVV